MVMSVIIVLSKLWVDGISKLFSHIFPSRSRSINREYEYIQQSSIPTMHFQASLPRLPIPELEDTCRKYLQAQEPILSPEEFEKTSNNVAAFLENEGPKLQKKLLDIDAKNKHTSYISEPWFDMYLRDRKPLPINYNPWMMFYQQDNALYNIPLVKATNIFISSARFIKSLRDGVLEPEIFHLNKKKSDTKLFRLFTWLLPSRIATYGAYLFKAFPLDMSQFNHLFGTTRIPEIGKDRIFNNPKARHVLIMRRGHLYSFDLFNPDDSIRAPCEIASCVNSILNDPRAPNEYPIGILTATDRNQWARNRQHLMSLGNEDVFKKIDSATFLLALDDDILADDKRIVIETLLHSDGTNRWFDKSFTLMVTGKGWSGINFEHSWGDGVAVLRYCHDMKTDVRLKPQFHPDDQNKLSPESLLQVEKLNFKIDNSIKESVHCAMNEYIHWAYNELCIDYLIDDLFCKNECKIAGISPDAVMQLSFQLAMYKLEKQSVATYEASSTSAFKHGRTETIRSCTNETKALCKAIVESGSCEMKDSEYKKLMIECSKAHTALTKEAAMGQGFDRHLFMLKRISEQEEEEEEEEGTVPLIFKDPAFAKLNETILSTSTLSSPAVIGGGFGPVGRNGLGIGYTIDDTGIRLAVASYRAHRDATKYVACLKSALQQVYRILQSK